MKPQADTLARLAHEPHDQTDLGATLGEARGLRCGARRL